MRLKWIPVFIVISLTGILGFFQNCTPAVPFGTTDHYQSLVNSPNWAYEVGVDQVAYMSCSEQEDIANDGTFFTFRLGAFDSGGLRIAETYRSGVGNLTDAEIPSILSQATASSQARLVVAVRTLDNLQLNYRDEDNGEEGIEGSDYDSFFPPMNDFSLNDILWSLPREEYLRNYIPAQMSDDYRFEGELRFMKSQIMENDLRGFFNQQRGILALSWAVPGDIYPLGPGSLTVLQDLAQQNNSGNVSLPPVGQTDSGTESAGVAETSSSSGTVYAANNNLAQNIFGAAIQPRFKQPGTSPGSDLPPRVLSSIQDVVVDERMRGELLRPWDCPDNMQFMIVLPEDAIYQDANSNTIVRCAMDPDPANLTPELEIIRQSLYAEDFYIDMARRCIVPKPDHTSEGSCYGKNTNTQLTHIINYDSFATDGCGFGNANGLCPHFASVCFRQ